MRVFIATFEHIHLDLDKFVDSRHLQEVRETLQEFHLKLVIICHNLQDKDSWV